MISISEVSKNSTTDFFFPSTGHALNNNDLGVNLYKQFFREINDPIMKTQIFATLENHLDDCYNTESRNFFLKQTQKRDKSQLQKVRFHSWGKLRSCFICIL